MEGGIGVVHKVFRELSGLEDHQRPLVIQIIIWSFNQGNIGISKIL